MIKSIKAEKCAAFLLSALLLLAACTSAPPADALPEEPSHREASADVDNYTDDDANRPLRDVVGFDRDKIVYHDEAIINCHSPFDPYDIGHTGQSYTYIRALSYEDIIEIQYQAYLPRFTDDDIPYDGAGEIIAYFDSLAEQREEFVEPFLLDTLSQIMAEPLDLDTVGTYREYSYLNYHAATAGPYLSVLQYEEYYMGGAHGSFRNHIDRFDLRTGERIEFENLFAQDEDSLTGLKALILSKAEGGEMNEEIFSFDETAYHLREEGIQFVFAVSTYASMTFTPDVVIPYTELAPYLTIDLP